MPLSLDSFDVCKSAPPATETAVQRLNKQITCDRAWCAVNRGRIDAQRDYSSQGNNSVSDIGAQLMQSLGNTG